MLCLLKLFNVLPLKLSFIISLIPLFLSEITGKPLANASTPTFGKLSVSDGIINASQLLNILDNFASLSIYLAN